jgi:hypothetical protein
VAPPRAGRGEKREQTSWPRKIIDESFSVGEGCRAGAIAVYYKPDETVSLNSSSSSGEQERLYRVTTWAEAGPFSG